MTDDLGRFSEDKVQIKVRHPASSSVDYWTVFDDSLIQRIDILLPQAEWEKIWMVPEMQEEDRRWIIRGAFPSPVFVPSACADNSEILPLIIFLVGDHRPETPWNEKIYVNKIT